MIIEDILYLSNTYYNLCSNGSKNKTAVIIKGNPKFIDNNKDADSFYEEIKSFLEDLGFEVSFDKGEPYTSPDKADLWIGHSRGADRLRFAPKETKTLAVGSYIGINHPKDNIMVNKGKVPLNSTCNKYHYVFTDSMKEAIEDISTAIDNY